MNTRLTSALTYPRLAPSLSTRGARSPSSFWSFWLGEVAFALLTLATLALALLA